MSNEELFNIFKILNKGYFIGLFRGKESLDQYYDNNKR